MFLPTITSLAMLREREPGIFGHVTSKKKGWRKPITYVVTSWGGLSYTQNVGCTISWTICEMLPFQSYQALSCFIVLPGNEANFLLPVSHCVHLKCLTCLS